MLSLDGVLPPLRWAGRWKRWGKLRQDTQTQRFSGSAAWEGQALPNICFSTSSVHHPSEFTILTLSARSVEGDTTDRKHIHGQENIRIDGEGRGGPKPSEKSTTDSMP